MADWTDSFRNSESTATVEKPLEPVSTPQPVVQGDWTDSFRQQPNPNLSLKVSSEIPSDKAAQVLKLQDQTGLPTHVIGPNLEDVKAKQDQVSLGPQFIQDHPKTTDLLGSDQHWAALLRDDVPGVAFMERQLDYLANASMRSELELERTYHGLKGVAGLGGPDNSDRIAQIDKQLQTQFKPPAGANPLTQLFGKTSEVAVPYGVPLALGAIEGVPATIAAAAAFGAMETSNAYLDYKNKVDREGNPISDDTARRWAVASGALTGGLFLFGPSGKAAANPVLKMLSRGALGEMMEDTGLRMAVDKLLTSSIPSSMLKTGAFFGGSTWGHVAAGVMADSKDMSPMAILRTIFSPENNKQVLKATATGMAVGGTITAGMGAWNIWTDFSRAQEALNTQTAVMNVGNAMKNTKAFDIAPDQVPKVMDRLAGDGHKYIPLEKWQEWAETQKVDPRQAWQEATGSTQAYDEALKTGSDLQMSSKAYFSRIAASDHNEFFSKVLRSNPEAMNAQEAEAFLGKQTPEAEAKREAIYKVKEAVAPTSQETTSMNVPEPLPTPETEPITPAPQTAEIVLRPTSTGLPIVTPNEEALNAKGKPYALFVGNQEGVGPMYNVYGEHPTLSTGRYMHSTVSQETIKKEGIPVIGKTDKAKGEPEPMVSPEQKIANQHIDAAKQDLGHKPLDLEGLGMTETQIAGIREAEARSHQAAQDQMVKAITDRQRRSAMKEWSTEREGVESDVEKESWNHPEFVAQEILRKPIETKARSEEIAKQELTKYQADKEQWNEWRTILKTGIKPPSGLSEEYKSLPLSMKNKEGRGYDEVAQEAKEKGLLGVNEDIFKKLRELKRPQKPLSAEENVPQVLRELGPLKLIRSVIKAEYPEANMESLKGMLSDEVGVHPDEAAAVLGLGSGDELLQKLSHLPERNSWIQDETNRRMQDAHPELQSDTNMPEAAIKAIYNNAHGDLLRAQLKHFYTNEFAAAKGLTGKIAGRIPVTEELKADVMRDIGVKNWYALQPRQYIQAMRNNQMEAEKALKAGNFQGMVDAKRAELRSFEMYRAAQDARDAIEQRMAKIPRYFKRQFQEMLGKAEGTYREDVNKLLADPTFQNYKTMPFKDLMAHLDAIDSKIHEAREKGKLYALEKFKTVDDLRTAVLYQIDQDFPEVREKVSQFPKPTNALETNFGPKLVAYQLNIETVANEIDNFKASGLIKQTVTDPINGEAAGHQADLVDRHMNTLPDYNYTKMIDAIPGSKLWYAKSYYVPEMDTSLIRPQLIRIARLRQNDYTWNAFLDGYGLTDAQGMAVISQLTDAELDLVDGMSKNFEAIREEAFALRKEESGIEPERVKPSPYEVARKDGTVRKMDGGYSPLTFDEDLSLGSKEEDLFDRNWFSAKPNYSNLKNRTNPNGKAPSLDLNSEMQVLGKMIRYVSYARPLSNAQKILKDKAVAAHIIAAVGKQKYDLFEPWLKDVAHSNPMQVSPMDHGYSVIKNAVMIAKLGWKTTSELKHLFNFSMAANELGIEYALKGLKVFYGNPRNVSQMWENIKEKSPYMRQMATHLDKDISDASQRLNIGGDRSVFGDTILGKISNVKSAYMHDFTRSLFYLYGVSYTSIAAPSWYGGYLKALDGEIEGIARMDEKAAIAYADRVVRRKIVSGNTADLAAVLRDKGVARYFTWYFRPSSLRFNDFYENKSKFGKTEKMPDDIAKYIGSEFLTRFIPALLTGLLGSQIPKGRDGMKKLAKWGVIQIASSYAELTPWTRFLPRALETKGHEWNDPLFGTMTEISKAGFDIGHHVFGHSRWSTKEIKEVGTAAGYFMQLPSQQMMDSWAVAHDWNSGHYRPSSTASGLWHVATGKEPKRG